MHFQSIQEVKTNDIHQRLSEFSLSLVRSYQVGRVTLSPCEQAFI